MDAKRVSAQKKTIVAVSVVGKSVVEKKSFNWVCEVGYADDEIEAKYLALIKVLEFFKERSNTKNSITIYSDCWMLVNQYNELMEIKEMKFTGLKDTADKLIKEIGRRIELMYIPKEENLATRLLRKQV